MSPEPTEPTPIIELEEEQSPTHEALELASEPLERDSDIESNSESVAATDLGSIHIES